CTKQGLGKEQDFGMGPRNALLWKHGPEIHFVMLYGACRSPLPPTRPPVPEELAVEPLAQWTPSRDSRQSWARRARKPAAICPLSETRHLRQTPRAPLPKPSP